MGFAGSSGGVQSRVLLVDSVVTCIIGLFILFFPHLFADFLFQKSTDGVHWHLLRCVGGQILTSGFVNARLRNSSPAARTVCYLLRITSAMIVLMLVYQSRSQTPALLNPEFLEFARVSSFGALFLYLAFLLYNMWPVGTSFAHENKIGNILYQLDCMASVMIGLAWLTFPKFLLHRQVNITLDESHELCGRLLGAFFVSHLHISQHALHWPSVKDRNIVVDSRVVCCAAILSAQIWSQHAYHDVWSGNHWVGISLFSTWSVIAFIYRAYLTFFAAETKTKSC